MCGSPSASMNRRCPSCGTVAREGAAYCPQCGTSLANAAPPTSTRPQAKGKFPFWMILFGLCVFGVYSNHHHVHVSTPFPNIQPQNTPGLQALPAEALQAIQPSQEAQWSPGGDIGLNIYNGSDWVVHSVDLQIEMDQGRHVTRQTYRAIAQSPLMPMESGYFSLHTALPRMHDESGATYRVVGAMGTRAN